MITQALSSKISVAKGKFVVANELPIPAINAGIF